MIPAFTSDGNLPPGVHWTTWPEFAQRFGTTVRRAALISGLRRALLSLKAAGCKTVYVDGSFVTAKRAPGDFDGCWDYTGVSVTALDSVLLRFDNMRAQQKAKYLGELFPAQWTEGGSGKTWLDFFQTDKITGRLKGIIALDLGVACL